MLDFALIDPTTPHPPAVTVSEAGVACFNDGAERVLALEEGLTFTVGAYVNPDDPPPMILLIDPSIAGRRPIPEVSIEKQDGRFCIDLANVFRQLDLDFTKQQFTLAAWVVIWKEYPAIALPFPPELAGWDK